MLEPDNQPHHPLSRRHSAAPGTVIFAGSPGSIPTRVVLMAPDVLPVGLAGRNNADRRTATVHTATRARPSIMPRRR